MALSVWVLAAAAAAAVMAAGTRVQAQQCVVEDALGCYLDTDTARLLNHTAALPSSPSAGSMTWESCASLCCAAGFKGSDALFGVEYGAQCFCGFGFAPGVNVTKEPDSDCSMPCSGNSGEPCGAGDRINVFKATCPGDCGVIPTYHGCADNVSSALPYCDMALSPHDRAMDLISRLSIDERIAILSPTVKPFCVCKTPPIPRIGLPHYKWLTETNSDCHTDCTAPERCVTTFVGPTGMAASFNRTSWYLKGDVVSTEMRAINNLGKSDVGLTGFGPNLNTVKDPRYGRNSELPGEDPMLSGTYATHYLQGMQQRDAKGYQKMLAYVKHFTAYNVETDRFEFKAPVSLFTMWDSYLPQYELAFTKGMAAGAMCSYFAPNGTSSCGNKWLLNQVIRSDFKRPDAVIMSDCSAVANMEKNGYAKGPEDASAKALNAGLNIYGGWNDDLWTAGYLHKAIDEKLTSEAVLNKTVYQTLLQKLQVGLFDDINATAYTSLGLEDINSTASQAVSLDAALQSMVLLKNDDGTLPFAAGKALAVVGPMALEQAGLFSDYAAAPNQCFGGQDECIDSIGSALARDNTGGTTAIVPGIDIASSNATGIPAALAAVRAADTVVLALGITRTQEHEGMDRHDTLLPGLQSSFALQVLAAAAGKPVVVTLCNGGILSIDELIPKAPAIIEAFNPARKGPRALSALIFGRENRWGKLPVTIYPGNYSNQMVLQDMAFHTLPGRSYRFYNGTALFPFGHGLSYVDFSLACRQTGAAPSSAAGNFTFECDVKNLGARPGDEVVMAFHRVSDAIRAACSHPVPLKRLAQFDRTAVAAGQTATVSLSVPLKALGITDGTGQLVAYAGQHDLIFSRGHGAEVPLSVTLATKTVWPRSNP